MVKHKRKDHEKRDRLLRQHSFWPLIQEIDELKRTLHELVADDPNFTVRIADHIKRIENAIPSNPKDISCLIKDLSYEGLDPNCMHIYCDYPLSRLVHGSKVPLDILQQLVKLLVSAGFDINGGIKGATCLHVAVSSGHYDAVRWLVEYGADRNVETGKNTPISLLAAKQHVP